MLHFHLHSFPQYTSCLSAAMHSPHHHPCYNLVLLGDTNKTFPSRLNSQLTVRELHSSLTFTSHPSQCGNVLGPLKRQDQYHSLGPTTLIKFTLVLVVGCKGWSGGIINSQYSSTIRSQPICMSQKPVCGSSLVCLRDMPCTPVTMP